jgi:hypothetical protein
MKFCQFNLTHSLSPNSVTFEEGTGVKVNRSQSGMLLLTSSAPSKGKLLEVNTDHPPHQPSVSLVEVRWSKPVRETSEGELHLVGCRRTFGPFHY